MNILLIWWALPSLTCLLLFLQLRHLDGGYSMKEFFESILYNEVEGEIFFIILIWPSFVTIVLIMLIITVIVKTADYNVIPKVDFSWLYKEWK